MKIKIGRKVLTLGRDVGKVPSTGWSVLLMKDGVVQGTYPVKKIEPDA